MATQKVSATVKYAKPGTQPPIYLAGSFSDPAWQPQEMQYTTDEHNEYEFHKEVEVEQGKEYQYKFRIGFGDWWTLNEDSPTVTDDIGNKNNLLSIPKVEETTTDIAEANPTPREHEHQAEQAESSATIDMEKEKTPPVEQTMGTRETDDALFADEIIKDTAGREDRLKAPATEGIIEPHPTPAIPEKLQIDYIQDAKHFKEPQDIGGTDTSGIKSVEEVIEPIPAPVADIKILKIHDLEKNDTNNVPEDQMEEDKVVAPPALVVENGEPESKQDQNLEVEAGTTGHDSSHLQTAEATQEHASRIGSRTPELADVAAEVADSAATLDQEAPTPPISDEEAGRIGFRRMSMTPVPQVASTAAEVADSAAAIDKEDEEPDENIRPFDIDDGDLPETPPNEKVPRFSHECCSPPDHEEPCQHEDFDPYEGLRPRVEEKIDLNDPSIKMFPTDRAGIMERLRSIQQRLPEDEVKLDLPPPSPVVDPHNRPDRLNVPAISPIVLAQRSPSLDSIAEDKDEGSHLLTPAAVKINGEDKPANSVMNVTKDEIKTAAQHDLPIPKNEHEALMPEPEKEARILAGSMEGRDNTVPNGASEQAVAEAIENAVPNAEKPSQDNAGDTTSEAAEREDGAEKQNEVASNTDDETRGEATNSGPEDAIQETPVEEVSSHHVAEGSMDGVCGEGTHIVPSPITPFIVGDRQLGHDDGEVRELRTGAFGPNITIHPATPSSVTNRQLSYGNEQTEQPTRKESGPGTSVTTVTTDSTIVADTATKHNDLGKSTAVGDENDDTHIKSRKRQQSPFRSPERPVTPSSMRSAGKSGQERNFLKAFWRMVFVDWIGGFFMGLCGGRRRRQ